MRSPWTRRPTTSWKTVCRSLLPTLPHLPLPKWRLRARLHCCRDPGKERSKQRLGRVYPLPRRPLPLLGPLPSSAGPNPFQRPRQGSKSRRKRGRRQNRQPVPQRARDGSRPPDLAPPSGLRGSGQASLPQVESAGSEKRKACVAEVCLVPHRLRGRPPHPHGAELDHMPDRRPERRIIAAAQDRILAAEPGRVDPARGAGPRNEINPHPGPSPGGSLARLRVLRGPAAAAMRRSAHSSAATGPVQVHPTKGTAAFPPRAPRGERGPGDPSRARSAQGRAPGRPPTYGANRSPAPYRSNQTRSGETRSGPGRSGPPPQGGRPSGPRPARFGASQSGAPRPGNPRPGGPRSDNRRPGNAGRPFPRPSNPGVRSGARPSGPRPPSSEGTGQEARSKPNPRGPGNERPRSGGYARPTGKPRPGGGGKGRGDRGPRPPFVPGSGPAKPWRRPGGSSAKPGKPSFRGRKPDRKKPGA